MKTKINRKEFISALQKVSPAVPNNNIYPILENVLVKDGQLISTNTNLTIFVNINYDGQLLLPHRLTLGLLQTLIEDEIYICEEDNFWYIESEGLVHKLGKAADAKLFPLPLEIVGDNSLIVDEKFFNYCNDAIKCEHQNETYKTYGILIAEYICATNNSVIYTVKIGAECNLHVTSMFIKSCSILKEAKIIYNNNMISAKSNGINIICKLIDQPYVNILPIVEGRYIFNASIDRNELIACLNAIEIYCHPIRIFHFNFGDNSLKLHYYNSDFDQGADYDIKCNHSIEPGTSIHLSVPEMLRILDCLPEGLINFAFNGNNAIAMQPISNKNILSFILPML